MDRLLGHRQTKGAATDNAEPNATAPHLDSTDFRLSSSYQVTGNYRVNTVEKLLARKTNVYESELL